MTTRRIDITAMGSHLRRIGALGFAFFFIKGLVWLGVGYAATAGIF